MAWPDHIRSKAVRLRAERHLTIDEIAVRLALPRTTVYYWVKDIPVARRTARPPSSEAQRMGTKAMQNKYRRAREAAYARGKAEYGRLIAEDRCFRDFVCLYLAEGYVSALRRFWADRLTLDNPDAIRVQRKSNSGQLKGRTWRCTLGVLTVRTCDTQLRARIEAWMDLLRASWT